MRLAIASLYHRSARSLEIYWVTNPRTARRTFRSLARRFDVGLCDLESPTSLGGDDTDSAGYGQTGLHFEDSRGTW